MNDSAYAASASAPDILHARALALARSGITESAAAAGSLELLEFRIARECYALETRHVAGVLPLGELTPVPCTPPFVLGIVNVRGRMTALIDVKKLLDLPAIGLSDLHSIVLVASNELRMGLLVDAIVGVRSLALDSLQPPLPTLPGVCAEYVKGLSAERMMVLDLDRLMSDPNIIVRAEEEF